MFRPSLFAPIPGSSSLDVVVTHKNGQPVAGLKPEDFTLEENGKKQKISVFVPPGVTNRQRRSQVKRHRWRSGLVRQVVWVETYCGIPTRRIKSWNRGSERKPSNTGSTLRSIIRSSRSSKPRSNHSNALSLSPTRTHASATSTDGTYLDFAVSL